MLSNFQYTKKDIICTDKYLDFTKNNRDIKYYKTDQFYTNNTLNWRGNIISPPLKDDISNVIIGHSDYEINDRIVSNYRFKNWFCVNKNTRKNNVFSLPLGVTNFTNESQLHPIYGNTDIFFDIIKEEKKFDNLVYLNFNMNTYPSERGYVYNLFKDKDYVTIGNIQNSLEGRKKFLEEVYNHKFILCPRGNGLDTHRLWESLYMRSIPIVKRDIYNEDFSDLPILFVDDWNEINEDFLKVKYEEIMSKEWNLEKLKIEYWFKFINYQIKS